MANNPLAHLTRRYEFSASHRLHSNQLSEDENWEVYGKCNNPYGHGHNYYLEVTVAGRVDSATGMVVNLVDLDRVVKEEVLDYFDHKNLNLDLECFRDLVPTSENLLLEIADRLEKRWDRETAAGSSRLVKAKLQETGKNFFEYRYP
jgi:6-pyruvoyltetrahydropterin/6-carboxytetrahydropterin synthase